MSATHLGICEKDNTVVGSDQRADVDILVLVVPDDRRERPHNKSKDKDNAIEISWGKTFVIVERSRNPVRT